MHSKLHSPALYQCTTRSKLQKLIGIGKNPFPFHGCDKDQPAQDAPEGPTAAGTQRASCNPDSNEEVDNGGALPAPAPVPAAALLPIEWDKNIDSSLNVLVWRRATLLIFQREMVCTF